MPAFHPFARALTRLPTLSNCNASLQVCTYPTGSISTSGSTTTQSGCQSGYLDIDGSEANGCEYSTVSWQPLQSQAYFRFPRGWGVGRHSSDPNWSSNQLWDCSLPPSGCSAHLGLLKTQTKVTARRTTRFVPPFPTCSLAHPPPCVLAHPSRFAADRFVWPHHADNDPGLRLLQWRWHWLWRRLEDSNCRGCLRDFQGKHPNHRGSWAHVGPPSWHLHSPEPHFSP